MAQRRPRPFHEGPAADSRRPSVCRPIFQLDIISPPALSTQLGLGKKDSAPTADMDAADRLQAIAEARERRSRVTDDDVAASATS